AQILGKRNEYPLPRQSMLPLATEDDSIDVPAYDDDQASEPLWPTEVSCEMNIEAWQSALLNAGLLPEFEDVISGFNNGFPQGIPSHLMGEGVPYFTPPNHASAWEVKDKFEERLQKELAAGRMFGPFTHDQVQRQIPTAMDQWPFLLVKNFEDMLLLDTRITFGGVSGCGSFGLPADAWKAIMLHEFDLISIFRWVDNNLFVKNIDSQTEMEDIVSRSNELGVKKNDEKFSPFATEQKHIGFVWNGVDKTVRLPDGKLFDRVNQLKTFAKLERFSYHNVELMTGRLNHVSYILPQL
ncbi:uncharacterized protein PGTG_22555, partial [Puccinia graminis f. sp. tritici CRL 75-36-700-3]